MAENKKLEVKDLTVSFRTTQGLVRAVRGVSFDLHEGETLAIVGESGSGKSVTSRTIMGILAGNGIVDDGSIVYEGEDLTKVDEEHFHEIRGNKIGMIFQDPMSSLNPIMKIGKQITEGMILNGKRLDNRYKELFNEERVTYNRLKRFKKQGDDITSQQLADAKKALNEKKQVAKGIVSEEWNAEKERVRLLVESVKVREEAQMPGILVEAAKMKKDFDAKTDDLYNKRQDFKAKNIDTIKPVLRAKQKEFNRELRSIVHEIKDAKIARRLLLNTFKDEIADLKEQLARYKKVTKKEAHERALVIMEEVGIDNPEQRIVQYPFQFSGGMRQRIVIAIALTAAPDVLICDEPTTALDVTIQAQILELINDLKRKRNLSVIFITHDLGVVANMADRIAVMYAGKIVEIGTSEDVFYDPRHPYTWALLSSMPDLESKERLTAIPGTPPNMLYPPVGDAFAERNSYAMKIDFDKQPPMFDVSDSHSAATWLLHKDAPKVNMPSIIQNRINRMLQNAGEVL